MLPISVVHSTELPQPAMAALWSVAVFFAAATVVVAGAAAFAVWDRLRRRP